MSDFVLKWQGADRGREGMLHADSWYKTLEILSHHVGEDLSDVRSPVFNDLEKNLPENAWRGQNGRLFFRGYQQAWTSLGVLIPTAITKQAIVISPKGKRLLENVRKARDYKVPVKNFFRTAVQYYTEEWPTPSGPLTVSPFEIIATALLATQQSSVKIQDLQTMAEALAAVRACPNQKAIFKQGDTPSRRFKSYFILLENAEAIERKPGVVNILDRPFLQSLIREGLQGFAEPLALQEESTFEYPDFVKEDLRRREMKQVAVREGQQAFAAKLKQAYGGRCCITGCGEDAVLQACHIVDYCGKQSNVLSNGLLLAADIHILFDRLLLGIDPYSLQVVLSDKVRDKRYTGLNNKKISVPSNQQIQPNRDALEAKFTKFIEKDASEKEGAAPSP